MNTVNLGEIMSAHFIGIGGIGMSALAQLFLSRGVSVTGSDREASVVTQLLEKKGAKVTIGQKAENLPASVDAVIYSDAVWADNPERDAAAKRKLPMLSYFEALGSVSRGAYTIAVTGTHGKTTTTGMLAKALRDAGKQPTAIVGSLVKDFDSNFLAGDPSLFVVEACEYRNHLFDLSPTILVLTNVEWDHTDFFKDLAALQETFRKAALALPAHGAIVTNPTHPNVAPLLEGIRARVIDYTKESVPPLQLIGHFNEENARAAKAAARAFSAAISPTTIDASLASFKGSWRRFEFKGTTAKSALVYDDYAHHPTAIRETLAAAREKFPDKKITIVFHPHLYSRTRDLFEGFAAELAKADSVILVPIYPARENPIPGVTSDELAKRIAKKNQNVLSLRSFGDMAAALLGNTGENDLVITMGAGDVYKVAEEVVWSRHA